MDDGDVMPRANGRGHHHGAEAGPAAVGTAADRASGPRSPTAGVTGCVIETVVSPFHCLYQDALEFHTLSQLRRAQSEAESSRLARASLLLYLSSAEALVHQAAVELGRPGLAEILADPAHPLPLDAVWRLLPCLAADGNAAGFNPDSPPWPQFAELLALRRSWSYPGPAVRRRAYYLAPRQGASFEPIQPYQVPHGLSITPDDLSFPRTGLPRDPYALRPQHLDTARLRPRRRDRCPGPPPRRRPDPRRSPPPRACSRRSLLLTTMRNEAGMLARFLTLRAS